MSGNLKTRQEALSRIISQRVHKISPSGIRKFFDILNSMEDAISLGVGEPDYTTPWHIRESAIYSLEKGYTMYTSNLGMPELRLEVARYLKENYSLEYDPQSQILITVGASEAFDLAARAVIDPGDEAILPDPCYVAYDACINLAGGTPVSVPTCQKNNFELEATDVESRINNNTKAIVLGYPANPTGAVMPQNKLKQIAELALKNNLLVISDEIYARLVYGVEHTCMASLPDMKNNTILIGGFSKAYAMTGWRVGYAASTEEIIAAMTKIHQYTIMSAPTMGQVAAIEALKSGGEDIAEMVEDYNRRRMVMVGGLRQIGLDCFEPKGAFYAFPSIKSTGLTSEEFAEKLLIEEKVAVVPGNVFGNCGEGYIRCCYATSMTEIEEALNRMRRFVGKYKTL